MGFAGATSSGLHLCTLNTREVGGASAMPRKWFEYETGKLGQARDGQEFIARDDVI